MAKKKALSEEEQLERMKQNEIADFYRRINFVNEPTYMFNIGDHVIVGALKDCIIDEIYEHGKGYGIKCIKVHNNYGNPYEEKAYIVRAWMDIRPASDEITGEVFTIDDGLSLYFSNQVIESLIHSYYSFGIDMNPEYQRDYIWTMDDKIKLLDSIFNKIDIGKFVLNHLGYDKEYSYEIVDGKQRLSTLIEFYENRFPYHGVYFNNLNGIDKRTFLNHDIAIGEVENADRETILKYFIRLNTTGKTMSENDIMNVRRLLTEIKR